MLTHHADFTTSSTRRKPCSDPSAWAKKPTSRRQPFARRAAHLEIGIALATEPKLLCLDEPTAGHERVETHDTMQLVRRIART
jgi:branched-chain amino acid transport system ATP-binding protein